MTAASQTLDHAMVQRRPPRKLGADAGLAQHEQRFLRLWNVDSNVSVDVLRVHLEEFGWVVNWIHRCSPAERSEPYAAVVCFQKPEAASHARQVLEQHSFGGSSAVHTEGPVDADEAIRLKWLIYNPAVDGVVEDSLHPAGVCTHFVRLGWCVVLRRCASADAQRAG